MVNIADMRNVGNNEEHLILYKQKGRIRKSQTSSRIALPPGQEKDIIEIGKKGPILHRSHVLCLNDPCVQQSTLPLTACQAKAALYDCIYTAWSFYYAFNKGPVYNVFLQDYMVGYALTFGVAQAQVYGLQPCCPRHIAFLQEAVICGSLKAVQFPQKDNANLSDRHHRDKARIRVEQATWFVSHFADGIVPIGNLAHRVSLHPLNKIQNSISHQDGRMEHPQSDGCQTATVMWQLRDELLPDIAASVPSSSGRKTRHCASKLTSVIWG